MNVIDNSVFNGHFSKLCVKFIKYKRSIGYKYEARTIRAIKYMSQYLSFFCINRDSNNFSLGKEIVLSYTSKRNGESPKTQEGRETLIRQFAIYLDSLGIDAYILPLRKKKNKAHLRHIFLLNSKLQIFSALLTVLNMSTDLQINILFIPF